MVRAMVSASLVNIPAGGKVETVFTFWTHFFFFATMAFPPCSEVPSVAVPMPPRGAGPPRYNGHRTCISVEVAAIRPGITRAHFCPAQPDSPHAAHENPEVRHGYSNVGQERIGPAADPLRGAPPPGRVHRPGAGAKGARQLPPRREGRRRHGRRPAGGGG